MSNPQQWADATSREADRIASNLAEVVGNARAGRYRDEKEWAMDLSRAVNSPLSADLFTKWFSRS
jgi:hypothetical protein